jgi:Ulp1 family protease
MSSLSEDVQDRTYIYDSKFYTRQNTYTDLTAEMRHASLKKWTKNVDIFKKGFVIIPVNIKLNRGQFLLWILVITVYVFPASKGVYNTSIVTDTKVPREDVSTVEVYKGSHPQERVHFWRGQQKSRKYLYFDQMFFLVPRLEDRQTQSNFSIEKNEEEEANKSEEKEKELRRNVRKKN